MSEPARILQNSLRQAKEAGNDPVIDDDTTRSSVRYVVRCSTKSGIRAVLACSLAKVHNPNLDIRKPYTEIGDPDSYSGRTIDEQYIEDFVLDRDLPANQTTAWLTPAFRTNSETLERGTELTGTPAKLYKSVIDLLNDVYEGKISASELLVETFRQQLLLKREQQNRLEQLKEEIGGEEDKIPLSSEEIVTLVNQHLESPHSSRLPVLVVAAAYRAAESNLGTEVRSLYSHNAPDVQTGALGDVEITVENSSEIVTCYEMKYKEVTEGDVRTAVKKIGRYDGRIDNYIFITTEDIDEDVRDYMKSLYRELGGVEIAILDCIGFLRHFLHLFHRLRNDFLDEYQELVLAQPDNDVPQPLKEAFLSLRRNAEEISS
jgi:DNA adenine methylase